MHGQEARFRPLTDTVDIERGARGLDRLIWHAVQGLTGHDSAESDGVTYGGIVVRLLSGVAAGAEVAAVTIAQEPGEEGGEPTVEQYLVSSTGTYLPIMGERTDEARAMEEDSLRDPVSGEVIGMRMGYSGADLVARSTLLSELSRLEAGGDIS